MTPPHMDSPTGNLDLDEAEALAENLEVSVWLLVRAQAWVGQCRCGYVSVGMGVGVGLTLFTPLIGGDVVSIFF